MSSDERQFENFLQHIKIDDAPDKRHRENLRGEMIDEFEKAQREPAYPELHTGRRTIMNRSFTKLAIAAVIIIAATLGMYYYVQNSSMEIAGLIAEAPPEGFVLLEIELPKPMFVGTPTNIQVPNLEPSRPAGQKRPPLMVPKGAENVAFGKPVTGSDENPIWGTLDLITDGDKSATDDSYVELGPFQQHITIDLQDEYQIYGLCIWHYHKQARVYFDIVVQVADDADFLTNVRTLFNNDHDNSSGLGIGQDKNYIETNEGKLIKAKGVKARYIRCYSQKNNTNDLNHYIEVAVYGKSAK